MFNTRRLFAFAAAAERSGQRVMLVTLYAVTGTSSRNPGTHLAVRQDGAYSGSLSDGCVEGTIVSEALAALEAGRPRELRLGQGSPYIDVRLPCGGSIDLLFNELPAGLGGAMLDRIEAREPFRLHLPRGDGEVSVEAGTRRFGVVRQAESITVDHVPPLRIVILGHGPTVASLYDLARSVGVDLLVATPDERLAEELRARGADPLLLRGLSDIPPIPVDEWSACVLFFHDHDWEPALLRQILASRPLYVGAMGSSKTHAQRVSILTGMGVDEKLIDAIAAPIGLIPSLRDPETLAVSTLAEVIDAYNRVYLEAKG